MQQQWTVSWSDNEPFLDRMCDHNVIPQLWHSTKVGFIWQPVMTNSVTGLGRSSKALHKAKLAPKKGPRHGWVVCYQSAFWIPVKPSEKYVQQINELHQKLQCLKPALVNRRGLILHHNVRLHMAQPMLQKLNKLDYKVLLHLPYLPDLLPADYQFFKYLVDFLQGKHFHNQQNEENAFQEFIESQRMDFNATAINLFHVGKKKCVYCNGSYFD